MINAYATVCIYYTPADLTTRKDPHADALLLNVIRPTMQTLRERGLVEGWTFMRFSERGYHLRLSMSGDGVGLRDQALPYLKAQVDAYLASHQALTRPSSGLAPISQVLNRKLGHAPDDLATPGTIEWQIATGLRFGDGSDNEHEAVFLANTALQTGLCEGLIDFLALAPDMKVRKNFVRQLLDDILRLALPSAKERYVFLQRIKSSWVDFFELQPAVLTFYQDLYQKNAAQFISFFDRKRGIGDSLALLPPEFHGVYRNLIALFERLLPQVVLRLGEGRTLSALDANRLVAVYHLLHNRLSLGIEEEVYLSFILSQYSLTKLAERDVIEAHHKLGIQHEQKHLRHLL